MVDTEQVPLGTSGLAISRAGLGAWAMGGGGWSWSWGPQDDAASIATIHHAVDLGVNWVDTAAEYGLGHSEEVVGRALAALPPADRPYVFTKCGMVWDPAEPMTDARPVADAASVRAECEASLRRLGVEQIDLLQVHWPPEDETPVEEYWEALVALRNEGKIRAAGLSNHDVVQLDRAEAVGHVDSLQPPFSLIDRSAAADVIPWCAAHGTGVIVYSPLHSGLLTGAFSAERVADLPEEDWRRRSPDFTTELAANLEVAAAVAHVAGALRATPAAVAVAWVLAWAGVSGAIVGARSPGQVDAWVSAGELSLAPEQLAQIASAVASSGAGRGPAQPSERAASPASPLESHEGGSERASELDEREGLPVDDLGGGA
jgi:aryl-alcohol dehydrogenase-like predicted oxidoreductase